MTPDDIEQKRFKTVRFKEGYDEVDVDAFLDEVVTEMRRLQQRVEELEAEQRAQ